jgi:hypothetical protein
MLNVLIAKAIIFDSDFQVARFLTCVLSFSLSEWMVNYENGIKHFFITNAQLWYRR